MPKHAHHAMYTDYPSMALGLAPACEPDLSNYGYVPTHRKSVDLSKPVNLVKRMTLRADERVRSGL